MVCNHLDTIWVQNLCSHCDILKSYGVIKGGVCLRDLIMARRTIFSGSPQAYNSVSRSWFLSFYKVKFVNVYSQPSWYFLKILICIMLYYDTSIKEHPVFIACNI